MGVLTREGPLYFQPIASKAYHDGWDRIFGKNHMKAKQEESGVKIAITAPNTDTPKRGRGRPKGSKNKPKTTTLEVKTPTVPKELPSADYRKNVEHPEGEDKGLDGSANSFSA